jgi:hypothetical protein
MANLTDAFGAVHRRGWKPKSAKALIKAQGYQTSLAAAQRSERIHQLLPMVSRMRHSQNPEALLCAKALQEALSDMERLNEIELLIAGRGQMPDQNEKTLNEIVHVLARE